MQKERKLSILEKIEKENLQEISCKIEYEKNKIFWQNVFTFVDFLYRIY